MKVFVIMPFDNEISNDVYNHCVKPVCASFGLEIFRGDEIFTPSIIMDDILSSIKDASIIIADISGKNPNVFYELGIAHLLKSSQTIMIYQGKYSEVPFDISHFRIIQYEDTIKGKSEFEEKLRNTIKNLLKDYRTIFKDEFELILQALWPEKWTEILFLIGINKLSNPLKVGEKIYIEGHDKNLRYQICSDFNKDEAQAFLKFGYVEKNNDLIIITDKGKSFLNYVEEKTGFVCDCINDIILTKGFISNREKFIKEMGGAHSTSQCTSIKKKRK